MKRAWSAIFGTIVFLTAALAADLAAKDAATLETEAQLLALTREWVDAETNRDEATLRRILDERLVATFGTGAPIGREGYVASVMKDKPSKMLGHTLSDETIVVNGDTAVLVGTDAIRWLRDGTETTQPYRYTATYIKREGRWTVLGLHMVRIPPAK